MQEEGQGWGGAHTNAGTHGLHRGVAHIHCALVPAPSLALVAATQWGLSGSKSLGLSPTKASPLFDASIGILGLPPYPHCSTGPLFKICGDPSYFAENCISKEFSFAIFPRESLGIGTDIQSCKMSILFHGAESPNFTSKKRVNCDSFCTFIEQS